MKVSRFNAVAPTTGFYTYGEFFGDTAHVEVLNSTMVVIGMREGEKRSNVKRPGLLQAESEKVSLFHASSVNKENNIVSRLVHFIGVVTSELEQANKELTRTSEIDKLTRIYNRFKLDNILEQELQKGELYHIKFSLIMVDIDHFKQVNDLYGHIAGDAVLIQFVDIIRGKHSQKRSCRPVGRRGISDYSSGSGSGSRR